MHLSLLITFVFYIGTSLCFNTKTNPFIPQGNKSGCIEKICNATSFYPTEHIKELLKNEKEKLYDSFFGSVVAPSETDDFLIEKSPSVEENLCLTRKVIVHPKIAYDVNIVPRFIVNIKGYQQIVSFETCRQTTCFGSNFSESYQSRCKQLYNSVGLLYLTSSGNLEYGKFVVPSSCVCTYV